MSVNRQNSGVKTLTKKDLIRGDKLRDLILLVYLNDKYGLGKRVEVSKLKRFLGYSTGGIYNALDESGYFARKGDEILLSDKGEKYVRKELMQWYRVLYPTGYLIVFLGIILVAHWYLYTYHNVFLLFDWSVGFACIAGGLTVRFALPALTYWYLKITKKV